MDITLNLIPPERKAEIDKNNQFRLIIKMEVLLAILLVFFFAVLLSFQYILNLSNNFQADVRQKNEGTEQYKKIKDYDDKFRDVNSQVSKILSIKKDQLYWSNLFSKTSSLVFSAISVDSISTLDYLVIMKGKADTREDLILFKEKLESESCFSGVDLPLSNLVDKNNVEFELNFVINKECLKKE